MPHPFQTGDRQMVAITVDSADIQAALREFLDEQKPERRVDARHSLHEDGQKFGLIHK